MFKELKNVRNAALSREHHIQMDTYLQVKTGGSSVANAVVPLYPQGIGPRPPMDAWNRG